MSEAKHTPGPWFSDTAGHIWRRPPAELYENGGGVAGDKPLATVNKGWYRENEQGYPVEANAHLIAAAPELLEAAKMVIAWYEAEDDHSKAEFYERMQMCRDSESALRAAIAKATGEQA